MKAKLEDVCYYRKEVLDMIVYSGMKSDFLADVVNYCVLMADVCGLDLDEIVLEKINRNNEKYPVEKAKGRKEKYDKLK